MVDLAREFFVRRKPMKEYTLPIVSLVAGHRVNKCLRENFGKRRIEDMLIPFLCTSSNLSDAERVIHDRGLIERALNASLAIPGVLPPVPWDGDLLVDGGALNNLPVDIMDDRYPGQCIACDVGQDRPLRVPEHWQRLPASGTSLWRRITASSTVETPHLIDLLYRSAILGSARRTAKMHYLADRSIRPLVAHIDTLDFDRLDEAIELGREAAKRSFLYNE